MYKNLSKKQLASTFVSLEKEYKTLQSKGLHLDMSRGKPSSEQLDLSMDLLSPPISTLYKAKDGTDCRNYGIVDGIPEAKKLFSKVMEVSTDEIFIGGNASLQLMYDAIAKAMILGVVGSEKPWSKYKKVKFLCPSPGYDRHFAICESLGIEMIPVEYKADGPDMDMVEKLVAEDESIKGIWCVPMYSNPEGLTYSDEVVRRFANLSPKAKDFRIFWDNAYCLHHISDTPDRLLNLLSEAKKTGKEDMVLMFGSTAKVTFAGGGVAFIAASKRNIDAMRKEIGIQTIGFNKLTQLHIVNFFKDIDGIHAHMKKHAGIIKPKMEIVLEFLEREIAPLEIGEWKKPNGGYFISFNSEDGCAKRIVQLCKNAGVVMTPAGAAFPYGNDPRDRNIRIAPTFPPVSELEQAMEVFCISVKLATVEMLLKNCK